MSWILLNWGWDLSPFVSKNYILSSDSWVSVLLLQMNSWFLNSPATVKSKEWSWIVQRCYHHCKLLQPLPDNGRFLCLQHLMAVLSYVFFFEFHSNTFHWGLVGKKCSHRMIEWPTLPQKLCDLLFLQHVLVLVTCSFCLFVSENRVSL